MKEKIERYIQGAVLTNGCNLACDYCYLKLQGHKNKGCQFVYSFDVIEKAMSKDRWGVSLISLTGDGETLLDRNVVELANILLNNGHFLNIVNNGTQTNNLRYFINSVDADKRQKVMFTFSLHYIELKRRGLLDTYFNNIKMVRNAGCSIFIHLVLAEQYLKMLDEIKTACMSYIGALPHVGLVRDESDMQSRKLAVKMNEDDFFEIGHSFNSSFFGIQEYLYKKGKIKDYCYAGQLGILLNFSSGNARQCMCNTKGYNVFEKPNEPIRFEAVGHNCSAPWCFCDAFQILGMIPQLGLSGYADAFNGNRKDWATDYMKEALNVKLADDFLIKE